MSRPQAFHQTQSRSTSSSLESGSSHHSPWRDGATLLLEENPVSMAEDHDGHFGPSNRLNLITREMSQRLSNFQLTEPIAYTLAKVAFIPPKYLNATIAPPSRFDQRDFLLTRNRLSGRSNLEELVYSAFLAQGARLSSDPALIGTNPSSESTRNDQWNQTAGLRREGACQALVERMLHHAQNANILNSPSADNVSLMLLVNQTLHFAAPQQHWTIIRFLVEAITRHRRMLLAAHDLTATEKETLAVEADTVVILDATSSMRLGPEYPCLISSRALASEYKHTKNRKARGLLAVRNRRKKVLSEEEEKDFQLAARVVYIEVLRGCNRVGATRDLDHCFTRLGSLVDDIRESLPDWQLAQHNSPYAVPHILSLQSSVLFLESMITSAFARVALTTPDNLKERVQQRFVSAVAKLEAIMRPTVLTTPTDFRFIGLVWADLNAVHNWPEMLATAADQASAGEGVMADSGLTWQSVYGILNHLRLASFVFELSFKQREALERAAQAQSTFPGLR